MASRAPTADPGRRSQIAPAAPGKPCTSAGGRPDARPGRDGTGACQPHARIEPAPVGGAVITALAGGVGAARMLPGLLAEVPADSVTAVVNTGDDTVLHGLHIAPDLDTVIYTLAGAINPETGWGLAGETLAGHGVARRPGRRDLVQPGRPGPRHPLLPHPAPGRGGHPHRGDRRALPAPSGWGSGSLPVTDDPLRTRLQLVDGPEVGLPGVLRPASTTTWRSPRSGSRAPRTARPGPGVLEAIAGADAVVVCPSNPVVSIGPLLAVPGVAEAAGPPAPGRSWRSPPSSPGRPSRDRPTGCSPSSASRPRWSAWPGGTRPWVGTLVVDQADAAPGRRRWRPRGCAAW